MASPILRARQFFDGLADPATGLAAFAAGGSPSVYGTVFAAMTRHYLGQPAVLGPNTVRAILAYQNPDSGYFEGPDIASATDGGTQDREHLAQHLTCHVLPALELMGAQAGPIVAAREWVDPAKLQAYLDARDWRQAWLEGNNLLFVGQLLMHLRDVEHHSGADVALERWFAWHEQEMDPATGLWGTNGFCSAFEAMCGGYHQLLLFYAENRALPFDKGLIDTTLALQHPDGGFSPHGGGGACEDADAVDILVNAYKRTDHRRGDIRVALRRCVALMQGLQNSDGGYPYSADVPWVYMGMQNTVAAPSQSHAFGTWFRVHTLALAAEVLDDPLFEGVPFAFNRMPSMGWHRSWTSAERGSHATGSEVPHRLRLGAQSAAWNLRRGAGRMKRLLRGRS